MYHSVDSEAYDYLTVSVESFCKQIRFLSENYTILPIKDAFRFAKKQLETVENPLVITFDDGFLDNYLHALPILEQYNAKAVFFIPAAYIGKDNRWDHKAYRIVPHLNAKQIVELHKLGYEIGNHTLTHQRITKLSPEEINFEYCEANRILMETTGVYPEFFAFPYGASDPISADICRNCFSAGFTTVREGYFDWNKDSAQIRRIYVSPDDTADTLEKKIDCYRKGLQHE